MATEATPLDGSLMPKATAVGTGFNMFKNIVGAGLLGLPYAVSQMGLCGFVFMGYSATASVVALYFIAASADLSRQLGTQMPHSYKAIAATAFGVHAGAMVDVIIMFYTGLELVAYGVLIADFFGPPLVALLGPSVTVTTPMVLTVAGLLIFGLCCLPNMEALKYSSLLGNLALFYTVLLVGHEWWTAPVTMSTDVEVVNWTPQSLRVAGIYVASFNFHYNMPIFYSDMQPCSPRRMMGLVSAVYTAVLCFYVPLALCGYLLFGSLVQSNVLRNFGDSKRFVVCRIALGLMVMCTFPIITVSTRSAVGRLVFGDKPLGRDAQVVLSLCIVLITCSLACIVPSFGAVLAYNGAVFGTLQQLIFPSAAFFVLSKQMDVLPKQRLLAVIIGSLGVVVAVIGTVAETYSLTNA